MPVDCLAFSASTFDSLSVLVGSPMIGALVCCVADAPDLLVSPRGYSMNNTPVPEKLPFVRAFVYSGALDACIANVAREAGVSAIIVQRMLLSEPVARREAERILAALTERARVTQPTKPVYSLHTVEVVLDEPTTTTLEKEPQVTTPVTDWIGYIREQASLIMMTVTHGQMGGIIGQAMLEGLEQRTQGILYALSPLQQAIEEEKHDQQ